MLEKLTKMVPKWSQNLSKIDPGGGLEATWEPPLKQDASKNSFLTILASFWDALWNQFGLILGLVLVLKSVQNARADSTPFPMSFLDHCWIEFGYIVVSFSRVSSREHDFR